MYSEQLWSKLAALPRKWRHGFTWALGAFSARYCGWYCFKSEPLYGMVSKRTKRIRNDRPWEHKEKP